MLVVGAGEERGDFWDIEGREDAGAESSPSPSTAVLPLAGPSSQSSFRAPHASAAPSSSSASSSPAHPSPASQKLLSSATSGAVKDAASLVLSVDARVMGGLVVGGTRAAAAPADGAAEAERLGSEADAAPVDGRRCDAPMGAGTYGGSVG